MTNFIRKNSGFILVLMGGMMTIIGWLLVHTITNQTEAINNNTAMLNKMSGFYVACQAETKHVIEAVGHEKATNEKQWNMLNDHEKRLIKIEN